MKLVVALLALACVADAAPRTDRLARAARLRERVRKAIEYLQTAQSIGEFAINTPTGLYPVGEINEANIPDVFRFRREFDELRTIDQAELKTIMAEATSAPLTAENKDDVVEGSAEGSGHDDDDVKPVVEKKGTPIKRETIDEELLTHDGAGELQVTAWKSGPGKAAAAA